MQVTPPLPAPEKESSSGGPRVCFILTTDLSTIFLRGYLNYLRERGWRVTVIARDEGRLHQLGVRENVDTIAVPMRRDPAPLQDLACLVRMTSVLRRIRPDAVVYSTPKASLLASTAARLGGVRSRVYELWGLRYMAPGRGSTTLRLLEKIAMRNSTEIISTSRSIAEKAIEDRLARTIAVLGGGSALGVDVQRFSFQSSDIPPLDEDSSAFLAKHASLPVITYVGRLNRDKGVDVLLEAAQILGRRGRPIATILVGPSESDEILGLAHTLRDSGPVHVTGWRSDPRPYILAAKALCLPTLREGFGQVVIEAGALGVPAVTTTAVGARDSTVHEVTGLLVPVRDPDSLADALLRIVTEPGLSTSLGRAARERSIRVYSDVVVWPLHAMAIEQSIRRHSRMTRKVAPPR